jgi:hypothetical protein
MPSFLERASTISREQIARARERTGLAFRESLAFGAVAVPSPAVR